MSECSSVQFSMINRCSTLLGCKNCLAANIHPNCFATFMCMKTVMSFYIFRKARAGASQTTQCSTTSILAVYSHFVHENTLLVSSNISDTKSAREKCPYFWSYTNFLTTQCRMGGRKPPRQKSAPSMKPF